MRNSIAFRCNWWKTNRIIRRLQALYATER